MTKVDGGSTRTRAPVPSGRSPGFQPTPMPVSRCRGDSRRLRVCGTSELVDEMIRRPRAGKLHLAFVHEGAGGGEFVLIALHALAVDQVRDIQQHLAVVHQPATDFFIERLEEPMHLEADGARTRLPLARPRCVLAQIGEIGPANAFAGQVLLNLAAAAVVDKDLQVHLRLTAELIDIAEELALIGADGLAQDFVVV